MTWELAYPAHLFFSLSSPLLFFIWRVHFHFRTQLKRSAPRFYPECGKPASACSCLTSFWRVRMHSGQCTIEPLQIVRRPRICNRTVCDRHCRACDSVDRALQIEQEKDLDIFVISVFIPGYTPSSLLLDDRTNISHWQQTYAGDSGSLPSWKPAIRTGAPRRLRFLSPSNLATAPKTEGHGSDLTNGKLSKTPCSYREGLCCVRQGRICTLTA